MAEKQHEALDEGDLYQDVAEADGYEIDQGNGRPATVAAFERERQHQKCDYRNQGNQQHKQKYEDSQIHLPIDAAAQSFLAKNLPRF